MIAEVIPLKRLPRHLGFFDYAISDEHLEKIQIGQLVTIPFRTGTIHGIIFNIKNDNKNDGIKEIMEIVQVKPLFSRTYLEAMRNSAVRYGVSYGTMLNMSIPPLQKKKLRSLKLGDLLQTQVTKIKKVDVSNYTDIEGRLKSIEKKCIGSTFIIVPEQQHIEELTRLLPESIRERLHIWHSRLSVKEQFTIWTHIRNNDDVVVIGTRGALFLPFQKLHSIIVDFEHDINHKHADQAPRFFVKDVVSEIAKLHGADISYISFSMSFDSYLQIQRNEYTFNGEKITPNKILFESIKDVPTVIHKTAELGTNIFKPLSPYCEDQIRLCMEQGLDIFVMINKKDDSTEFKIEHREILKFIINTRALEQYISRIIKPFSNVEILRIEKESTVPKKQERPRVIIGTTASFPYIQWERTGCIVWLEIDRLLGIAELSAREQTWHLLEYIMFKKQTDCPLLIETSQPDHLIFKSLTQKDRFYRTELSERKEFNYPPYYNMVRYYYGNSNKAYVTKTVDKIREQVKLSLTNMENGPILTNQFELYGAEKGMFWQGFAIKYTTPPQILLSELNPLIPEDWKIDPFPLTLTHI